MNKVKLHINENRILYRMIARYSLVLALIILLMTSVMYGIFGRNMKQEIYRCQVQNLEQIANSIAFRAEYANNLMLQLQQNRVTAKLFYSKDEREIERAIWNMDDLRSKVKYLHSIYIYDDAKDCIYYSGEKRLSTVSSSTNFEDQGFVEVLHDISKYPKYTPFLRRISMELPNGQAYQTYVYTYLLYDTYRSGNAKNLVALNFQLGWMRDVFEYISTRDHDRNQTWIINADRQIIYSPIAEKIGTYYAAHLLPDDMATHTSGFMLDGEGMERKMLVYASPKHYSCENWTLLSWNDYSFLMEPLDRVRTFIYGICVVVILSALFLIARLSNALYKPVRQAMDRVESLEEDQKKKQNLEKNLFLRKLFLGNVQDDLDKMKTYFEEYQIEGETQGDIRIILVSVDYLNSYLRKYVNEIDETDEKIEQIICELFRKENIQIICVKMQNGIWAICVPSQGEQKNFSELFGELNASLNEQMEITVSMSISGVGHSARDIPYLYSEAVNIHSYRYLWGQNRLITNQDIQNQGKEKFVYPSELEKKFLSNLFAGKLEETMAIYEDFVEIIRIYTVEEIRLSFMLLAYGIKNASAKTMAETSSVLLEFDKFYKKLQAVETVQEVHQMFKNLIGEITDKLKAYSKERHEVLIEEIKAYVDENYGSNTLSMNELSDHVNMSAAYLGRLFKQVTGTTFTEYLTKYRLNKACALLRETDKNVNEISDEVGFTNSSYFYIIFKKNMDCTPNQYRRENGNSCETEEDK